MQRGRVARRAALWIWLLALAGFVAAIAVGAWQWGVGPRVDSPLMWWGLLVGLYAAEWLVVSMRYGGRAHVFTMGGIPLIVELLTIAPVELLSVVAMSRL